MLGSFKSNEMTRCQLQPQGERASYHTCIRWVNTGERRSSKTIISWWTVTKYFSLLMHFLIRVYFIPKHTLLVLLHSRKTCHSLELKIRESLQDTIRSLYESLFWESWATPIKSIIFFCITSFIAVYWARPLFHCLLYIYVTCDK